MDERSGAVPGVRPDANVCSPLRGRRSPAPKSSGREGDVAADAAEVAVQQHKQGPILTVHEGGALAPSDADREERAAWAVIAHACERALMELSPLHPERRAFVEMWAECRRAAQLPLEPALSQTACHR